MSKTKIRVSKSQFPSTMDGSLLTTNDISKYINSMMKQVFLDYTGCIISIDQSADPSSPQVSMSQNHPVQCSLYFAVGSGQKRDDDDKRIRAFELLSDTGKKPEDKKSPESMNFIARAHSYQMAMTQNKVACITKNAADILSEYLWYEIKQNLPKNVTPKILNDKGIAVETTTSGTSQQNLFTPVDNSRVVYGVIRFIDIAELFHALFGDEEDSRCYYQLMPVKPIVPVMPGMMPGMVSDQKWLICVNRLNEKGVRDLLTELGSPNPNMGPNINTNTI